MRLYQLEYFLKIVECGSITKAAQELYLSQPSLTKAIASLEAEYNIQLFQRSAKGIHLTPKGRDFLEYAETVVESSHVLEETFGEQNMPIVPSIMIASQQFDFVHHLLVKLYHQNKGDSIQINLKETDRGTVADLIAKREADIGLLVLTDEDTKIFRSFLRSKDLEMHVLDTSSVYVNVGPRSALYDRTYVNAEEAEQYLHVILDTEASIRRGIKYRSVYRGVDKERLIFCNSINTCRKFLEETDALLNTPKWVLGLFEGTKIRSIPLRVEGKHYSDAVNRLVWIKRKQEKLNALEKQFVELLEDYFKESIVK